MALWSCIIAYLCTLVQQGYNAAEISEKGILPQESRLVQYNVKPRQSNIMEGKINAAQISQKGINNHTTKMA